MTDGMGLAWIWYIAGSLIVLAGLWLATQSWRPRVVVRLTLFVLAALLLCPYSIEEGSVIMAPATLMIVIDLMFESGEMLERAGPTLLGSVVFAVLLASILQWLVFRGSGANPPVKES